MVKSAHLRLIAGIFVAFSIIGAAAPAPALAVLTIKTTPSIKPPAPGPIYLSVRDHERLLAVSKAAKSKRYSLAQSHAAGISDPIAKKLGAWLYYAAYDPRVSIAGADRFLDENNDWPAVYRIQTHVEKRISNNTPTSTILAFFDTRDPVTGPGKIQLARALFSVGDNDAAEIYLHDAWVNNNFTVSQERQILSSYGGRLKPEDHAARVDRLLWSRQVTKARRIFSRLSSKDRRMAEVRAALLLGVGNAPTQYGNLREEERLDSGVLLAAVRHFRRRGNEQHAISLAALSPKDPTTLRNSSRWWDEQQLLMRWALKKGKFADAYSAAANHGLEAGGDFAEAEFNAGWIALRFMNEPERAETHFYALASAVATPISLARAYYWLGRAAEARGLDNPAQTHYAAAARYPYSYYGQLAAEKVGGAALESKFDPPFISSPEDRALFSSRPTAAALRMLADLDLDYEFSVFAYHADDQLEKPGEYIELAKLVTGEGAPHLAVRAGKVAIRREAFTAEVAYPLIFIPDEATRYVSPEIILGLSRQESEFNPRAYSSAGARGLMQLIPSTAQITARKEGLTYNRSALLDDPIYNMTIGSAHLSHLVDRYNGSLVMTFAAYNAGAGRVTQWVKAYGDPRGPGVDPVDWVELIPFAETRNYVQRVLENTQVYRGRLNDTPIPGRLSKDLERGGTTGRAARNDPPSATLITAALSAGEQKLTPLPERTRLRVKEFTISGLDIHIKPKRPSSTSETALTPKPSPIEGVNEGVKITPEKSPPAASTPKEISSPAPPALVNPALVNTDDNITESEPGQDDKRLPAPAIQPPAPTLTPKPKTPLRETLPSGAEAFDDYFANDLNAQQLAPPGAGPAANETSEAPTASPADPPAITAPLETPATSDKTSAGATITATEPTLSSVDIDQAGTTQKTMDQCLTYRAFLATAAQDDIAAADLNAGMLAELEGGGGCK